jgi:hypothetical protein
MPAADRKDYAAAVDGCKQRMGPGQVDERQSCFAQAREKYYKSLS